VIFTRCFRSAASVALGAAMTFGVAAAAPDDDKVRAAAGAVNPPGRLYRVGLDLGHRLMLGSDRPFRLVDAATGSSVWKDAYTGEIAVLAQGGPEEDPPTVYRIQVAAFTTAEAAEQEKAALARTLQAPVVVRYVPDRGSWRVRVGEAKTRGALSPLLTALRDAGRKGLWIAEEAARRLPGVSIRLWMPPGTARRRNRCA
jgi:hypothetical protein